MYLSTSILGGLAALPLFFGVSSAADCTAQDQVFPWGDTAVQMMWSMRDYGCSNAWWQNIKIVPQGNWCYSGGAPCWNGWWYFHNHPSQQACWDVLEEIINQCMWSRFYPDNSVHTSNGGSWSYGSEYSEGWFYAVNSKRDIPEASSNVTLQSTGDVVTAARTVYLNFDENGNVTGVAHDISRQEDGTFIDLAA
ncbi:hypothetical protein GQ53DRAFT_743144 [Thozetella sp. PMI_491]|nr:hypothetical protein GQ53DRAFT_743144 [Thozetella sp. PMI_491]